MGPAFRKGAARNIQRFCSVECTAVLKQAVRLKCRILYVGHSATHKEIERLLLPDPRLLLEYSPCATEAVAELRTRTGWKIPNLVIYLERSEEADAVGFVRAIKTDERLASIPIIVLTAPAPEKTRTLYASGASCVVTRGSNTQEMRSGLEALRQFWLTVATLPYCSEPTSGVPTK